MKTLTLELNRTLLVVDVDFPIVGSEIINNRDKSETIAINIYKDKNAYTPFMIESKGVFELLCKGGELSEEIASTLVNKNDEYGVIMFQNYKTTSMQYFDEQLTALDSFCSAVNAKDWYWLANPLGEEPKLTEDKYKLEYDFISKNPKEICFGDYYADWFMWQDAQSLTLSEQCLIFIKK